jgi:hypothetical protein
MTRKQSTTSRSRAILSTEVVSHREQLSDAIYTMLEFHPGRRRRIRPVRKAQEQLRRVANKAAWQAYLDLEQVTNERGDEEFRLIAKWAFTEGQREAR